MPLSYQIEFTIYITSFGNSLLVRMWTITLQCGKADRYTKEKASPFSIVTSVTTCRLFPISEWLNYDATRNQGSGWLYLKQMRWLLVFKQMQYTEVALICSISFCYPAIAFGLTFLAHVTNMDLEMSSTLGPVPSSFLFHSESLRKGFWIK